MYRHVMAFTDEFYIHLQSAFLHIIGFCISGATYHGLKIVRKKIPEVPKRSWICYPLATCIHSIYIVLGIISIPEMILSVWGRCVGDIQGLHHFIWRTWVSLDFSTGGRGPGNSLPSSQAWLCTCVSRWDGGQAVCCCFGQPRFTVFKHFLKLSVFYYGNL